MGNKVLVVGKAVRASWRRISVLAYRNIILEIHFSVKNLAPVSVQDGYVIPWPANPTASGTSTTQLSRNKVRAGSELLDHWQTCWEQIHNANEKNIKKANRSENNLMLLYRNTSI